MVPAADMGNGLGRPQMPFALLHGDIGRLLYAYLAVAQLLYGKQAAQYVGNAEGNRCEKLEFVFIMFHRICTMVQAEHPVLADFRAQTDHQLRFDRELLHNKRRDRMIGIRTILDHAIGAEQFAVNS